MKNIVSPAYSLKLKFAILFLHRGLICFFRWSYSQRCFDVAQRSENRRWNWQLVWTFSNVLQLNVDMRNVVSTLLNDVNFNFDLNNVVSTLIWRCATSWRRFNLKTTLNRRWNVCWGCTNNPDNHIHTFCKRWNFFWWYVFTVSSLKVVPSLSSLKTN